MNIHQDPSLMDAQRETKRAISVFLYNKDELHQREKADLDGMIVAELESGQYVTMTGFVGDGIAQIKSPFSGWVDSTHLRMPTNPGAQLKVLESAAPNGLIAYDELNVPQKDKDGLDDGPDAGSIVHLADPLTRFFDDQGRELILISYRGRHNKYRKGYVSQGAPGCKLGDENSNFELIPRR